MAATYSSLVGLAVGGKYEIRRVLGVGGMGVVCEAIHQDLGKRVAVKLIDKSMKESELIVARFRREAKAAGKIKSEHIVDVTDVGADPRVGLYMVMEHLAGEDLSTRLEKDKRLDVKTAVMIAHQIARGLAKAHEAGVIHRDLKPANVFLTTRDNGQMLVKLLDFGVSKLLGEDPGSARITGSGAPIGTPLYMSPEQAEGKPDVDGRADVWSLGAVLYEAIAGTPPFPDRGSYHGTIVGILTSRPKLLHDAAPWVPPDLAKVVDAMLVHDRDARIKDAATVTQRLLDAFPAVLPDGTGRHTAVIVPQQSAAVDMTGDTELFSSAAMPPGLRGARPSRPTGEDSSRTVPDVTTSPGIGGSASDDARRTAAATPVGIGAPPEKSSAPPPSPPATSGITSTQRMDPVPKADVISEIRGAPKGAWTSGATSSASGVAMPGTPPALDPLPTPPPSQLVPDTMRDVKLATRAELRRKLTIAASVLILAAVGVAAFLAGQRSSTEAVRPPPPLAPLSGVTPNSAPPAPTRATPSAAPPASASSASPATSAGARAPSDDAPAVAASSLPSANPAPARPAAGAARRRVRRPRADASSAPTASGATGATAPPAPNAAPAPAATSDQPPAAP
jgi:serine/threonine-protein kinase